MVSNMNDNRLALVQIILHLVIPGYNWTWILSYWARVRVRAIANFQFTSHQVTISFLYTFFMLPILFPHTSCTLCLLFLYMHYMVNYDCLHRMDLIKIYMNSCTEYLRKGFLWGECYTFELHKNIFKTRKHSSRICTALLPTVHVLVASTRCH